MANPLLRIILCGKSPQIATSVRDALLPEYETIHILLHPSTAKTEILQILSGTPPSDASNLGTRNYSQTPGAVVLGGGYDDADYDEIKKVSEGEGMRKVVWLRPDMSVQTPPLGPEYGKHMVGRVKKCLGEVVGSGGLEGKKGELVFY